MASDKFTDNFFEFPIKMYEGQKPYSDDEDCGTYTGLPWISGKVRVHKSDIGEGMYYQEWIGSKSIDEVREEGYNETAVWISAYGEFICLWDYKKFEAKLNAFMEKHQAQEKTEEA